MVFRWLQEGPKNISVFGRDSRTTSALEAYNGALGKRIKAKGDFYNFAKCLQQEEFTKMTDFKLMIESGGTAVDPRRNRVSKRHM